MQGVRNPRSSRLLAWRRVDWRTAARGLGKALIGAGVLILLFVVYQLYGTGIAEARSQRDLKRAFNQHLAAPPTTTPGPTSTTTGPAGGSIPLTTTTTAALLPPPPTGAAVAIMQIPKIGLEKAIVEGVEVPDLQKGPGHYPGTPLPGQPGNAAIAGHRTTYGAPFFDLNELDVGDPILFTTREGHHFEYDVIETKVVKPSEVGVVDPTTDNRLTLTTCNPRYSASQRLVVVAKLRGEVTDPAPAPSASSPTLPVVNNLPGSEAPAPDTGSSLVTNGGLGGDRSARLPSILWALVVLIVGVGIWFLARRWRGWRRYAVYAACSPVFLLVLFFCFQQVNRLLPANI
jgi:sortase A